MILARNVSHFIFPGLHTMYVLTIRGNSSQMTRKVKIDDFNLQNSQKTGNVISERPFIVKLCLCIGKKCNVEFTNMDITN